LLLEDPFRTIDYIYKKTRIGTLIFYFTPAHFSYLARELSRTKKVYDFFSALSKDKYRVHHFAQGLVRKNAIESFFKPLGLKDMETVARAMGHNIGAFMDGLFYVKDSDKVQIAQSFAKALTEVETTPYTRYGKVVGSRDIPKIYPFVQYMGENSRVFARELVNNDSLGIFLSGLGKEIYWLGRGLGLKSGSFAQGILGAKNSISGLSQLAFGLKDHINSFNSGLSLMLEKPGLTTLNARKLFMDRFTTQLTGYFKKYLEKQGIDSRVISRFISGY